MTDGTCETCGRDIRVMAFLGDRYCSINCERIANDQEPIETAGTP